jgi:signal transduction histidine kinase/DNA-binding response OmpR family regulator
MIGVGFSNLDAHVLEEQEIQVLEQIAQLATIAVDNARLYTEAQDARKFAEAANDAKSAFLASVSHELRTPLTSVLGFARIIQKRFDERIQPAITNSEQRVERAVNQVTQNLQVILSEGERLTNLINDVLDLEKIESGQIIWKETPVDMVEVLYSALEATDVLIQESGLAFSLEVDDVPTFTADRDRMLQVMVNLISNALKFTKTGTITCRVKHDMNLLRVSIGDTGIGIPQAEQGQIFEKFKQVGDSLTGKPGGTGLGLSICKEIIEHYGGKIWVESVPGTGSNFSFALSLGQGDPKPDKFDTQPLVINRDSLLSQLQELKHVTETLDTPQRILVVDDEIPIRTLLRQELEHEGYTVEEATNGREALEMNQANPPDLVLLDIMMPEINGFDVVATLRQNARYLTMPIVIISIVENYDKGYNLGVDYYMTKPVDMARLLAEVDSLLNNGALERVLVADTDEANVARVAKVLQRKGYMTALASDEAALLRQVVAFKPDALIVHNTFSSKRDFIQTLRVNQGLRRALILIYE